MGTVLLAFACARSAPAQDAATQPPAAARSDSIDIHLVDVDLRTAVQALSRYLDRPVVLGNVGTAKITIETPQPVKREDVTRLLRGVLGSQNFELAVDTTANLYRVQQREQVRPIHTQNPAVQQRGAMQLFVVNLRHARASEVAATINAIYGRAGALGELGARPPTLSRELQQQQVTVNGMAQEQMQGGQRGANLSGEVTIVPDPRANSLLIRANQGDYDLITAAVKALDVRPLQVLIEVTIAEVRKDRGLDFGIGAELPKTTIARSENSTIEASTTGASLGDLFVKIMGIDAIDLNLAIRAAAGRGDATILSRPVILAANNEPAEINVGSQRPFVQVARVLPTDNASRDQVVQYKDVGTRLRVVPTISSDGYVMLQVSQEINAATAEKQFDAPIISTRSLETRLLVRDTQTVMLGGLTDRQKEVSQSGVPVLSSIPLIGGVFGRYRRATIETELFLFLTPRIIRNDSDSEAVTTPAKDRSGRVAQ